MKRQENAENKEKGKKKSKKGFEKRIKGFYLGLAQLRKLVPE